MALEIDTMQGVSCLKGKVSNSHVQEVKGYFKALLSVEDSVTINLYEIKKGKKKLKRVLDRLKIELAQEKSIEYHSLPKSTSEELYEQLINVSNFNKAI